MDYKLVNELLAGAIRLAYAGEFSKAHELLNMASEISGGDDSVSLVKMAVICEVSSCMIAKERGKTEKELSEYSMEHTWFRKNHKELIEGSEIVSNRLLFKDFGMIPDFIVKLPDGSLSPVECKKKFRKSGYRQLFAYMETMKSRRGFAVARDMVECDDSRVVHFLAK